MRKMMGVKGTLAIVVALLFAALSGYLFYTSHSDRQRFEAELAAARAKNEGLEQQLTEGSRSKVTEAELDRLRAGQNETLKLRAEVGHLKQEVAAAKSAAGRSPHDARDVLSPTSGPALLNVEPLPESNAEIAVHKTETMYARVSPTNSAILAGGWRSESGRRLYALIRPSQDASGANQVSVATHWFEISDDAAQQLRIAHFDTSGNQLTTYTDFSLKHFEEEVEKFAGTDFLSTPTVTTVNGQQARVAVTESRNTSGGSVEVGPQIDVLPRLTEDGAMEIGFRAGMVELRKGQKQ